jgi:hypothetical protein
MSQSRFRVDGERMQDYHQARVSVIGFSSATGLAQTDANPGAIVGARHESFAGTDDGA